MHGVIQNGMLWRHAWVSRSATCDTNRMELSPGLRVGACNRSTIIWCWPEGIRPKTVAIYEQALKTEEENAPKFGKLT